MRNICNLCGKELDMWDMQEDFRIRRKFGYGTQYDGDDLDLRLCCSCMEMLISECVVSPIGGET